MRKISCTWVLCLAACGGPTMGPGDGDTYCNACIARRAGVDVASDGICGTVCGGIGGGRCSPTQYCDYPDGAMCGATDAPGTCREASPCDPGTGTVCGCNGVTYSNN